MISDRELWACANQLLNHHGPDVDQFIAERMGALAAAGDEAGTKTWLMIHLILVHSAFTATVGPAENLPRLP